MGYKRHLRENDLIAQCVAQPLRFSAKAGVFLRIEHPEGDAYFFEICVADGCKVSFCTRQFSNSPT